MKTPISAKPLSSHFIAISAAVVAFLATAVPGAFAQVTAYSVTDLGTLGGTQSYAYGLNDAGQVVGFAYTSNGTYHAFLYSGRKLTDLGTLGGSWSRAYAINFKGEVVGDADRGGGEGYAFLYSGGTMKDLGALPGYDHGLASGINSNSQVVGCSIRSSDGSSHGVLYSGGAKTDLGTLGGSSSAADVVNNLGQVAGLAYTTNGLEHAFLWNGGSMTDLGAFLVPSSSVAYGINDNGQVVGYYSVVYSSARAFLYSAGSMTDLGDLGGGISYAEAINNSGQIVGDALTSGGAWRAVLYTHGGVTDLNRFISTNSGWTLTSARAINNKGQIAGYGVSPSGQTHAFLLTPEPNVLQAVRPLLAGLQVGTNYQLQISGDLFAWTNHGAMLIATNASTAYPQYWDIANANRLFFRALGAYPSLLKAVKPAFYGLVVGTNYQLEASGDLMTWTNVGAAFTATNTGMVYPQYWDVGDWDEVFFRAQASP